MFPILFQLYSVFQVMDPIAKLWEIHSSPKMMIEFPVEAPPEIATGRILAALYIGGHLGGQNKIPGPESWTQKSNMK